MKRIALLATFVASFILFGSSTNAFAAAADPGCAALSGSDSGLGTLCTLTGSRNATGAFTLGEPLSMAASSKIVTGATGINITITSGDFTMASGAMIDGNVTTCGTGGPISLNVQAGNVNLMQGSIVRSDSCSGGAIAIATSGPNTVTVAGTVESVGSISGTSPHQKPGGGTITINAGCNLTVSNTGVVSSVGKDPGSDLVHLQGCSVAINGLVQSTGSGHVRPDVPANHCNLDSTAHPLTGTTSPFYSSCLEIWSATTVTIDNSTGHNGQVNADTGLSGGAQGRGWIDIYADGDITIKGMADPGLGGTGTFGGGCSAHVTDLGNGHTGCTALDHYAVHANGGLGANTDDGGMITIVSQSGGIGTFNQAVQAAATNGGGDGGDIRIEAAGDIAFGTASINARGAASGTGGHIGGLNGPPVRSYSGSISGTVPGELNAAGGSGAGNGTVIIRACTSPPTYTGTVVPALTTQNLPCGPATQPTLPASVTLPTATCSALFCQIIKCQPTPPFSWQSLPPGVTGSSDPGYAAGHRGTYNKDGSDCGDVGYSFTNTILSPDPNKQNTVDLEWDTNMQPNAAFEYTMNWKLRSVDPNGWTESQPQVAWLRDGNGNLVYMNGIVCSSPNLPSPYGTLSADIDAAAGQITINTSNPPAGGFAKLPPTPFALMIGTERLLAMSLASGTTYNVARGQPTPGPPDHQAAPHLAGALVMSTPLPIIPAAPSPPPPYIAGTVAHVCISDHGWTAVGQDQNGNILIEYSTTVIDIGDSGIRLP